MGSRGYLSWPTVNCVRTGLLLPTLGLPPIIRLAQSRDRWINKWRLSQVQYRCPNAGCDKTSLTCSKNGKIRPEILSWAVYPSLVLKLIDRPHLTQHSRFEFTQSRCGVNTQRNHIAWGSEKILNFTRTPGRRERKGGRRKVATITEEEIFKNDVIYPAKKSAVLRGKWVQFYLILNLAKVGSEG